MSSVWRQKLVWTVKAKAVFFLALVLQAAASLATVLAAAWPAWAAIPFFLFFSFIHFIFLSAAVLLLSPLDSILKNLIIRRAKSKLSKFPDLKIIAITGSYGKTTMKEMLAAVLGIKFQILKTPENINTPVGIARLLLRELRPAVEIMIVEMGAYQRGDIAALCRLAPPAISVLAGINESHLERFGSLANTVAAKFEIIDFLKQDGLAVLNSDNDLILKNYQNHLRGQKTFFYTASVNPAAACRIDDRQYGKEAAGQTFSLVDERGKARKFKTDFLGDYAAGAIMAAFLVGRELGLSDREMAAGVSLCRPVAHRLNPFFLPNDVVVIDDSYNGNPAGVDEAINVLKRMESRRKIFITPGLVEMGSAARNVHLNIGRRLAGTADLAILIRNSVTPFIKEGLLAAGFPENQIMWFNKITDAHAVLPQLLRQGDAVLFQNDWPDNYF